MMNKELFDQPATEEYISKTVSLCKGDGWDTSKRFNKEQSKDFYLGMIAGARVILSFTDRFFDREDLKVAITKLSVYAAIITNEKQAINNIVELYKTPEGKAGGFGHIVFDDGNIETENILFSIKEAKESNDYDFDDEETRQASLKALYPLLEMTEDQRKYVIEEAHKITRSL